MREFRFTSALVAKSELVGVGGVGDLDSAGDMSDVLTPEKASLPAAVLLAGGGSTGETGQEAGRKLLRPPEVDSVGSGLRSGLRAQEFTGGGLGVGGNATLVKLQETEEGSMAVWGSAGGPLLPGSAGLSLWAESSLCFNGGGVFLLYE